MQTVANEEAVLNTPLFFRPSLNQFGFGTLKSRTLVGPMVAQRYYEIPFDSREQFKAAWPKLLLIKTEGAPSLFVRGPTRLGNVKAGVWIHTPPEGVEPKLPAKMLQPVDGKSRSRRMNANYIKLIIDGEIVDLNRIPLPNDCPIIDLRFEERPQ